MLKDKPSAPAHAQAALPKEEPSTTRIPVIQEELHVHREQHERTVQVRKHVTSHEQLVDETLTQQDVHIERRPIDRVLAQDEHPESRYTEDGTLIIPVMEERLVWRKERVLIEEIHVHRREREERVTQQVTLRKEHVDVVDA